MLILLSALAHAGQCKVDPRHESVLYTSAAIASMFRRNNIDVPLVVDTIVDDLHGSMAYGLAPSPSGNLQLTIEHLSVGIDPSGIITNTRESDSVIIRPDGTIVGGKLDCRTLKAMAEGWLEVAEAALFPPQSS